MSQPLAKPDDLDEEAPAGGGAPGAHGQNGHNGHGGGGGEDGVFDNPRNVRLVIWGLYLACAAVAAADFIIHKHPYFGAEELPVFYGWYGFICFAGIVLAGQHLRRIVMRPEDYYDK